MNTNVPHPVIQRLQQALNRHEIDAFAECLAPSYQSQQPIHPDRAFSGREQAQKNWTAIFHDIPDLKATLLRSAIEGDVEWDEWEWTGTNAVGGRFEWRGVTIFGIKDDQIAWGRLYMEPVQREGGGIDAAVQDMTHGGSSQV